jgi:hypothetical protein
MQRARRVAAVAVLALVGGLMLTGCRSQPRAAVYVGSTRYTQKTVDELAKQLAKVPGFARGPSRQRIVQWLVMRDLGRRLVAANHWDQPKIDMTVATGQIQQAMGTDPAKTAKATATMQPLIKLYADFQGYNAVVQQHAGQTVPTEADYADLYARAKAAGLVPAGVDEAAYRTSLGDQNDQVFRSNIGLKALYAAEIKKAKVTINPRYAPAELPLLQDSGNHALVVLALDAKGGRPAVVPAPPTVKPSQPPTDSGNPADSGG